MLLEYIRSKEILLHSLPNKQTWLKSYLRRSPIHLPHNFEKQIHDMHFSYFAMHKVTMDLIKLRGLEIEFFLMFITLIILNKNLTISS
jgi:hypothetical protein